MKLFIILSAFFMTFSFCKESVEVKTTDVREEVVSIETPSPKKDLEENTKLSEAKPIKEKEKSVKDESPLEEVNEEAPESENPSEKSIEIEAIEENSKENLTDEIKEGEVEEKTIDEERPDKPIKVFTEEIAPVKEKEIKKKPSAHTDFDKLLSKHVSAGGKVNYSAFKADESRLDQYLFSLSKTDVSNLNRDEQLAFWINAYNAFTIKLILENHPVSSITNLENGKPWDKKWIKIGSKTLSLNDIENEIIRPTFKEPRIHFAVNCAAKSCPPLLNKAWTASNLEANLEKQTKAFINNSKYNTISSGSAQVSKIFEWYAVDFGDLRNYLNKYSNTKLSSGASINFAEYDWQLNN